MFPKIDDREGKTVCEDRKGQESLVSDSASLIGKEIREI